MEEGLENNYSCSSSLGNTLVIFGMQKNHLTLKTAFQPFNL